MNARLYIIYGYITVHDSIDGELRHTLDREFVHDILAVCDHGGKTDVETVGYLLVYHAFYY